MVPKTNAELSCHSYIEGAKNKIAQKSFRLLASVVIELVQCKHKDERNWVRWLPPGCPLFYLYLCDGLRPLIPSATEVKLKRTPRSGKAGGAGQREDWYRHPHSAWWRGGWAAWPRAMSPLDMAAWIVMDGSCSLEEVWKRSPSIEVTSKIWTKPHAASGCWGKLRPDFARSEGRSHDFRVGRTNNREPCDLHGCTV
jgi:hypothetical protein